MKTLMQFQENLGILRKGNDPLEGLLRTELQTEFLQHNWCPLVSLLFRCIRLTDLYGVFEARSIYKMRRKARYNSSTTLQWIFIGFSEGRIT